MSVCVVLEPSLCFKTVQERALAGSARSGHTSSMTLKSAAFLALIGTILVTVLLVWDLIFSLMNVVRGLVPAVTLFSSLIYAFGALTVTVFFFVFHKAQR
ncbi:MAG: hypothetical protein ABSB35_29000 [Bryobacteraceae bacterium]|jgi:hypothetical protein